MLRQQCTFPFLSFGDVLMVCLASPSLQRDSGSVTVNVKCHNYTWHSADQSTIQEVLECLRSTMKKIEKTGLKITKTKGLCSLSETSPFSLSLSDLWGNLGLFPLITLRQAAVSHHKGVHTTRVNEHVRTDSRQALSKGGGSWAIRIRFRWATACSFVCFLTFLYASPVHEVQGCLRMLGYVCVCKCVCGCVKRMWRRTQKGLLIIHFTIHSLPETSWQRSPSHT